MAMSKTTKWVLGIIGAVVIIGILVVVAVFSMLVGGKEDDSLSTSGSKIAVIELKETIVTSDEIVRQLKKFRENRSVKAIVLRVDSPGGGVAASQEIYEEVKKTREQKPVVVSMGSVAASGGYYVSCGATRIVANPGTLTGSIGVIMNFVHFEELMNKIGVDETTVKSGKMKDAGSPFRKLTDEEEKYFNYLIGDVYNQFVDVVVEERKLPRQKVLQNADGRVFTGKQAYAIGLVDTLGTFEDAISIAANLSGIVGKPNVVKEKKRTSFLERVMGDAASEVSRLQNKILDQPILQYKFVP
ncbi:MAG TPA: signal peptide peptidase SppA [Bacteroidota bacterium]|nr:signal peptide peptidase SppA [Bacteroidota bacterium]